MTPFLALSPEPKDYWMVIAFVAAWMVFMCLKVIASEVDHAIRLHNLSNEARTLRQKQQERLKALGLKSKRQ